MTSPTVADSFLLLAEKSGLLCAEEVSAAVEQFDLHEQSSAEEIARTLVDGNVLTRWQASRLLDGRYRGFFLDEYMLLELLGAGGMGRLYLARELSSGDKYVVKILLDRHKEDRGMLTRLQFEAQAGMKIKHPHIIRTLKLEKTRDVREIPYIVMEFVEGISLDELVMHSGRCSVEQACDFIRQAATGLHHAHQSGLIHRDIKPANLLVDRNGKVRILDFGLALLEGEHESEFSLTMIFGHDCVGTADYMSSEQAYDSTSVDRRADIFSLGCTFYSLLSGKLPFGRTTARKSSKGAMALKRSRTPPPLHKVRPEIPPEVSAIIEKMMAESPEKRFQSALHVSKVLEPFSGREPVEFDFAEILKERRLRAKQRLAALGKQSSSAKSVSTAAGLDRDTMPYQAPEPLVVTPDSDHFIRPKSLPSIASLPVTADLVREKLDGTRPAETTYSQITTSLPTAETATAFLIPVDGGEPIPLSRQRVLIGRKEHCDIQINSPLVSEQHCELIREGRWWTVRDLNSKNGIRINGSLVEEGTLRPGNRLTIAEQFHFLIEKDPNRKRVWKSLMAWILGSFSLAAAVMYFLYWLLSR
jgi:serine/threonine protein kinase